MSRASDRFSRITLVWLAHLASLTANVTCVLFPDSLLPMLPGLFAQFFGILKALISDYCVSMDATVAESSHWISRLSLLQFAAVVAAPMVSGLVATTMREINVIVLVLDVLITPVLCLLKEPDTKTVQEQWSCLRMLQVRTLRTPAGLWMLSWLFFLAIGYHTYNTIWMPSLGSRFGAAALEYGQLQLCSGIGGMFGTAIAGSVIQRACTPHPTKLIFALTVTLCLSRAVMLKAPSFPAVLVGNFVLLMTIGIINVVKPVIWMRFAHQDELGGVYGAQESVEGGIAPMIGPIVAGVVTAYFSPDHVFCGLVVMWISIIPFSYWGYWSCVMPTSAKLEAERRQKQA